MTFDDSTRDDDVATDERAIENHMSSPLSTCLVLAFVALAVVTLGALTCFQTNFPTRANLDRASSTRRNASKRVTIATPSRALTRPSFAVCVVGQVRAMARRDVREHARAALTTPLVEDGGDVEVFLHLDAKGMDEIMETTLREFWSPTSLEVYEVEKRGSLGRAGCLSAGWPQTFRQRACAEDVRQRERIRNKTFDWIVLTRPDIEYYAKLPPARAWIGLKKDLVLSGMCWWRDEINQKTIGTGKRRVVRGIDVEFMTDGFAIVSRDVMDHYTSMADEFESCVPAAPPRENLCGARWAWAECRAQQVAGNHTVGQLMLDDDKVKNTDIDMYMFLGVIFRCEDAPCARVRRDYCKIEPCDVIQRPIDVVFAEEWKQIQFTSDFYS